MGIFTQMVSEKKAEEKTRRLERQTEMLQTEAERQQARKNLLRETVQKHAPEALERALAFNFGEAAHMISVKTEPYDESIATGYGHGGYDRKHVDVYANFPIVLLENPEMETGVCLRWIGTFESANPYTLNFNPKTITGSTASLIYDTSSFDSIQTMKATKAAELLDAAQEKINKQKRRLRWKKRFLLA